MILKLISGTGVVAFILTIVLISGCKTTSKNTDEAVKINAKKAEKLWEKHHRQTLDYESVYLKSKLAIDAPQLDMGVRMIMYMVKDSLIWASISKLGFEIHRLLLKPDTIHVLDKLNRIYYTGSVSKWLTENRIPFGFQDLQRLLVGMPPQGDYSKFDVIPQNQQLKISGKLSVLSSEMYLFNWLQSSISKMVFDRKEGKLDIDQSHFNRFSGLNIPLHRIYRAKAEDEYILKLEISDIKLNVGREIVFRIPGNYERMSI